MIKGARKAVEQSQDLHRIAQEFIFRFGSRAQNELFEMAEAASNSGNFFAAEVWLAIAEMVEEELQVSRVFVTIQSHVRPFK